MEITLPLRLAIPPRVGRMRTRDGFGHHCDETASSA